MALAIGGSQRAFLPWPLLGLAKAPENSSADKCCLRWRLHCVDPESNTKDFFVGDRNRWVLNASQDRARPSHTGRMRTGVLEVEMHVNRHAVLDVVAAPGGRGPPMKVSLGESLSLCVEHRQPCDKGACCLCGLDSQRTLRQGDWSQLHDAPCYAARWGAMVELEAAASLIESNDSRFLVNVRVTWEPRQYGSRQRGSFNISVALARAHKLKFRGLLSQGGELAAGWLCMREDTPHDACQAAWSAHARIVAAGIVGEGAELGLDDEDNLKRIDGRRSITVVFEVIDEVSDAGVPLGEVFTIECIQKALSHSMQHTALAELNPRLLKDGTGPKALLARDVVLSRLPQTAAVDPADLGRWNLNDSQDHAVRRALCRPLMLVHGPPGTGKTRTAAILMTVLAQRNLGTRCAMLFAAPTNKACDAALHSTNRLCEGHFAERLRARIEEDGEAECAICLEGLPDVVTACGHVFHRACLGRALRESSKCPICRQVLKQQGGGIRILRVYGADSEREDFPVPRRVDHKGVQTFKTQTVPGNMRRFSLHWRCHAAVEGEEPSAEAWKTRQAYERLRATGVRSPDFDERRAEYYDALTKARAVEVHQSDIIFTTCVSARRTALVAAMEAEGAPELRQVIVDEAGQAPEPEALCPLAVARHARQAILFGDHKQLRPILRSRLAEDAGLGISLFERLATRNWDGHCEPPVRTLAQQYRMHPAISRFPCQHFYDGCVLDDCSVLCRTPGLLAHPGSGQQASILLWDSAGGGQSGQEQLQRVRTVGAGGVGSRCNLEEAVRAVTLATDLAREAGKESVAVLSWYNNQVAKVADLLRDKPGMDGMHVGSIATAQGSEWDYVILSAVRSGLGGGSLGLVACPHNLNVALTRAKLGVVILCDTGAVRRDRHWMALISRCEADGLVIKERPAVRSGADRSDSIQGPAFGQIVPPPPALIGLSCFQGPGGDRCGCPAVAGGAAPGHRPEPSDFVYPQPVRCVAEERNAARSLFVNGFDDAGSRQITYTGIQSAHEASNLHRRQASSPTPPGSPRTSYLDTPPGPVAAAPSSAPVVLLPNWQSRVPAPPAHDAALHHQSHDSECTRPQTSFYQDGRGPRHAPTGSPPRARRRSSSSSRRKSSRLRKERSGVESRPSGAKRRTSTCNRKEGSRNPNQHSVRSPASEVSMGSTRSPPSSSSSSSSRSTTARGKQRRWVSSARRSSSSKHLTREGQHPTSEDGAAQCAGKRAANPMEPVRRKARNALFG